MVRAQPSISGCRVLAPRDKEVVDRAVLAQKAGMDSQKATRFMHNMQAAADDERVVMKKNRLAMSISKRWRVDYREHDLDENLQRQKVAQPQYQERKLMCAACAHQTDTADVQVHVPNQTKAPRALSLVHHGTVSMYRIDE